MQGEIFRVIKYRKLNKTEKNSRYFNMKARCGKEYQDRNPRYYGTYMCDEWLTRKEEYYKWLDENYYEVEGEGQMDVDKDILQHGNKQYHPDLCLIVPHSINTFFENVEVGKTSIKQSLITKKYKVKIYDSGKWIISNNISTYNDALDVYCDIKQGILLSKSKALKNEIPEKVYMALMNTDVKDINSKYYLTSGSEV